MAEDKPNYRPNKTNRRHGATYKAENHYSAHLEVGCDRRRGAARPQVVVAGTETFVPGVTYSLNKNRRWELQKEDFEAEIEESEEEGYTTKRKARIHVGTAELGRNEKQYRSTSRAFGYRYENEPVDDVSSGEEEVQQMISRDKASKKDRKRDYKKIPRSKERKINTQLANSHSEEVYHAGRSDVLVTIKDTPQNKELLKPENCVTRDSMHYYRSGPTPRAHKYKTDLAGEF